MKKDLSNVNVRAITPLPSPLEIKEAIPLTETARATVIAGRRRIAQILLGEDPRFLMVIGPCSIHNTGETLRYAKNLATLATELKDQLLIVMRLCGDKPRTGKAWTGFWNDPDMNNSYNIKNGWTEGRKLAIEILNRGLPLGFEFLDAENFQRIDDIPSYVWLGARDVGSQRQRQIASGISAPVGFKNHNVGGVKIALDAMGVAVGSNVFVSSNDAGRASRFVTDGNKMCHLIHRGTEASPNYDAENVLKSVHELMRRGLLTRIMVDASHGNSRKDHHNQKSVIMDVVSQVVSGNKHIAGILYESYLEDGNQSIPQDLSELLPDISVTDACDGWETTERVLREVHTKLSQIK